MNIIEELRTKPSRDNRQLLDRAARTIEDLDRKLWAAYAGIEKLSKELATMREILKTLNAYSEHIARDIPIVADVAVGKG